MRVKRGDIFSIELDVTPSAGYEWRPSFVPEFLAPAGEDYAAPDQAVGATTRMRFRFRALKAGATEVRMALRRAWEDVPIEERVIKVVIAG